MPGCHAAPSCSLRSVDDLRQQPVHALRQRLDDEVVAVAIDDERRQQIGLAVNQPIRRRVDAERARGTPRAASIRPFKQLVVGRPLAVGQHADRDLRSIAVQRVAERPAARRCAPRHDRRPPPGRRPRRRGRSTDDRCEGAVRRGKKVQRSESRSLSVLRSTFYVRTFCVAARRTPNAEPNEER